MGQCCVWLISVAVSVGVWYSLSNGHHKHVSCCVSDNCVTCLEKGDAEFCDWPCDFPDDDGFAEPSPYGDDMFDFDDEEGTCSYTNTYETDDIFEGEKTKTWVLSSGCSDHCLLFDTREEIYESENVETKLTQLCFISMIMTCLSIIPICGSVANIISDVTLTIIFFSWSGFIIVSSGDCNVMFEFETTILWLIVLQFILDAINAFLDFASLGGLKE